MGVAMVNEMIHERGVTSNVIFSVIVAEKAMLCLLTMHNVRANVWGKPIAVASLQVLKARYDAKLCR